MNKPKPRFDETFPMLATQNIQKISCGKGAPCVFVFSSEHIELFDITKLMEVETSYQSEPNKNNNSLPAIKQLLNCLFDHYWDDTRRFIRYNDSRRNWEYFLPSSTILQ